MFSSLSINTTRELYGWQVHGDRLGDRPATLKTYMDPGYNSSCAAATYALNPATLPYTDLFMLNGSFACDKAKDEGYGQDAKMSWYFVPVFK